MNSTKRFSSMPAILSLILAVSIVLSGCAKVGGVATEAATAVPSPLPSDTPVPTSTSTATATPVPTETATPTATVTRTATPDLLATLAAKQTATQASYDGMVAAELAKYDIDPAEGHVAWVMKEPVELDGTGYSMGFYKPINELGVLRDFVLQSEVLWDTSGGLSGCGYLFRAREDWDLSIGDFYNFYMMRLQYAPTWFIDYYEDGRWMYSLPNINGVSSSNILDDKMSRNVVTLVARGDQFTIYMNGKKERMIENNKLTEGRLAFEVMQESGTSYCKFEKGWVWEFDD